MKCDILITYCWNRVGYNILRSLTAKGLKVIVADTSEYNICSVSKFSTANFVYPDPFTAEEEFITFLLKKVDELQPRVLLPTHDESIVIARHRQRFPKELIIPVASEELLIKLSDKKQATMLAKSVGVPTPEVYNTVDEAKFPCVFKTVIGNSAKTVFYPKDADELKMLAAKFSNVDTLIEERCSGVDYCVDCVRYGDVFYSSVYKGIITKTSQGGTTTQRVIVEAPELQKYARTLLDAVDYNGVCGVDFKYDEQTGRAAFIEVNARYTGGLATPVAAGFDIPYIHYLLANGKSVDFDVEAKVGTKTKWVLGDIITFVGAIFDGSLSWNKFKQLLSFDFDALDDYKSDDPKAIIGEMSYYLMKLFKNGKLNP